MPGTAANNYSSEPLMARPCNAGYCHSHCTLQHLLLTAHGKHPHSTEFIAPNWHPVEFFLKGALQYLSCQRMFTMRKHLSSLWVECKGFLLPYYVYQRVSEQGKIRVQNCGVLCYWPNCQSQFQGLPPKFIIFNTIPIHPKASPKPLPTFTTAFVQTKTPPWSHTHTESSSSCLIPKLDLCYQLRVPHLS